MGLKLCLLHFGPASPPKEFPAFSSRLPKNCCLTEKNERHTLSCYILVLNLNYNLLYLGALNYQTCTCVAIKNYVDLMSLMVSPTGLEWCLVCANGRAQLELISYCGQCTFVFVFVSVLESNVMCARHVCVLGYAAGILWLFPDGKLSLSYICLFVPFRLDHIYTSVSFSGSTHNIADPTVQQKYSSAFQGKPRLQQQLYSNPCKVSDMNHPYTMNRQTTFLK